MSPLQALCRVICVIAAASAQASDGCSSEILTLARATSTTACDALADLERCASQVTDATVRSGLETELAARQQQHGDCTETPLTAAIRTERDGIDFDGRDFTFHRTSRQSLNLYELRDQVNGFADAISTATASIAGLLTDGGAQAAATTALETRVAAMQQSMTTSVTALTAQISAAASQQEAAAAQMSTAASQQVAAATATANLACVPGLEYAAGNGVCRYLNLTCDTYSVEHYTRARPTRTSDRMCAPRTQCNSTAWEVHPGSSSQPNDDRVCRAITNCTALDLYRSAEATRTSDAVCISMPGLSQDAAAASCLAIKQVATSARNGFYWIIFGSARHQVYCEMELHGGGWTMVGRGNGNSRSCWMTNGDCAVGALSASYNFRSGPTARLSNAKINSLTYQRILMMGLSDWIGFGNDSNGRGAHHFWLGKDAGGCTYTHMRVASGRCNCASRSVTMSSLRCGSNYGTHKGVGDWPRHGSLHSCHEGGWWYIKNFVNGRNCNGPNPNCDFGLFIR